MLPVVRILGFTVPVGPLLTMLAYFVGAELSGRVLARAAPKTKQQQWRNGFSNAAFIALWVGLLGARLGYALLNFSTYLQSPQALISLRPAMLSPIFGLIAGGGVLLYLLRRQGVSLGQMADALGIGLATGLAVLALRGFLVGDGYGMPATWPVTAVSSAIQRHPVQLYEMVLLLGVSVWIWNMQMVSFPGTTFWRFVLAYSVVQLFVDAYRGNPTLWGGGFRAFQIVALAIALLAAYILSIYADKQDVGRPKWDHGKSMNQSDTCSDQ